MTSLFIGLGAMGTPMARHYLTAFSSVLYDVGPAGRSLASETGARALDSLDGIPGDVDTVLLMVPNSGVVESLVEGESGLLARLPRGALIIDMSSSVPASTRRLAEAAESRGIDYVDAPVSGGAAKAATGQLAIMVGGSPDAVARALPHLAPMSATTVLTGPSGSAHAAKALNNLLSATNIAAAAEILSVAVSFGIEPAVMIDVINASTGRSQATEVKFPGHILPGTYDSRFGMDLMLKDLGIARDLADGEGIFSPVTATTLDVAKRARSEFDTPDLDHTELARFYEVTNGIAFRKTDG